MMKTRFKAMLAAATAVIGVLVGTSLLHVIADRHISTSRNTHQLPTGLATPSSAASLKGYNVFVQCQSNELDSLVKIVSAREGRVQPQLDINTDLVITGADSGDRRYADIRQEAKSLHIPVLDQARFAKFNPTAVQ